MIRKILFAAIVLLNFSTIASADTGLDQQLYELITESEAQDLNIDIPSDLTSGYKSIEVSVTGMGVDPEVKTILFCKGLDGVLHWNNICDDLTTTAIEPTPTGVITRSSFPKFDPLSDPKRTTNTAVIAFAALSVMMGAGAITNKTLAKSSTGSAAGVDRPGYIAGLSRGGALLATTQLGRGDKSQIWQQPINQKLEQVVTKTGSRISGFSPLATRIISDGNYQRSLIGPLSLLFYPGAIGLGIFASSSLHQEALPPSLVFILIMMSIGVLDALAGVLVAIAFTLSVFIGGHLTSLDSALTVAGVCLLAFSPTLIAGAFRPFRRPVWDFTSLWERGTDYLVASILTGWVVQQIVLGLPGLSGLQLPITSHARLIALCAVGLIILRFAFEDLSQHLFPQRLSNLEPEYRERTLTQEFLAATLKITIFGVIAGRFVGIGIELFIGIVLFAMPLIMGIFEDKFPKSALVQKWMPTGIIEMLVMTLGGYFLAILVADRYPNAKTYVLVSFVILSLPGFILKILALFGKDGADDWRITKFGKTAYRVLGVVALAILIYIILSGLLLSNKV
jgi:hypothetical protein